MKPQAVTPGLHSKMDVVRLLWLAIFISVFSFLFFLRRGDVLLYGDAVAHINIARRVFDSKTPGILQLGTVWLPLPHLLILPFIVSNRMWQSGVGASLPSMAGFVFGVLGIFRFVRSFFHFSGNGKHAAWPAWAAAILYAANPNLIYMQATAMGESLYLAFFIWAVVYFADSMHRAVTPSHSLIKSGLCLAAACLTRYDGWFLGVALVLAAVAQFFIVRKTDAPHHRPSNNSALPSKGLVSFVLIAAAAPLLWLGYNAAVYKNPLEFANGAYSAKAIAKKNATANPANGNLLAAASYFVKSAELNVSETDLPQRVWLMLALLGTLTSGLDRRKRAALLLWTPLPFYALSLAYGSVPIFVPTWWPFSYYNVRYGLQLLPAFTVFAVMGMFFIVQSLARLPWLPPWRRNVAAAIALSSLALAAAGYIGIWRADPICYREAAINSRGRLALDAQVAQWLKSLPATSTILMYLGEHVGALQQAGIPLQRVINEGNHRVWRQPADPEGLWERALADPPQYADYAVGFENDDVWKAAKNHHLVEIVEIHTTGEPPAVIFQGRAPVPQAAQLRPPATTR